MILRGPCTQDFIEGIVIGLVFGVIVGGFVATFPAGARTSGVNTPVISGATCSAEGKTWPARGLTCYSSDMPK
jgi:hypothetical protein